jgi:hypothetical protein
MLLPGQSNEFEIVVATAAVRGGIVARTLSARLPGGEVNPFGGLARKIVSKSPQCIHAFHDWPLCESGGKAALFAAICQCGQR